MNEIRDIYYQTHEKLYGFILKSVQDEALTKDLLQEVFVKVQDKISTLKHREKMLPWLYQITRNTINDHYRLSKKNRKVVEPTADLIPIEATANRHQDLALCLTGMINQLPEKYRVALQLTEIEGLSQKAMAEKLGISYSGAKSRVQRGKGKLKEMLVKCCEIKTDKYGTVLDYETKKPKSC